MVDCRFSLFLFLPIFSLHVWGCVRRDFSVPRNFQGAVVILRKFHEVGLPHHSCFLPGSTFYEQKLCFSTIGPSSADRQWKTLIFWQNQSSQILTCVANKTLLQPIYFSSCFLQNHNAASNDGHAISKMTSLIYLSVKG